VKFFFTLYKFKEPNNTPHRQGHAMGILLVYNIKCRGTALNFTGQEREVNLPGGHEMGRKSI
jgi:hypothetical protein